MRLTPTSTYTQSFNPNTQASFTPTNNKSIEKNVQAPSQRTGARVSPKQLEKLFQFLNPPSNVPSPLKSIEQFRRESFHKWAMAITRHYDSKKFYGNFFEYSEPAHTWGLLASIFERPEGISRENTPMDKLLGHPGMAQVFRLFGAPKDIPNPMKSPTEYLQDGYGTWAKLVSHHYNNTNYERSGYFWNDVARVIDPNEHTTLNNLSILSDRTSRKPVLSMQVPKSLLSQSITEWLSGVFHIENPDANTPTVSVKLTGDSASDGDKLEVFARLLDALQSEAEKTTSA